MSTQVSAVYSTGWDVLASVSVNKVTSWNVGQPVQLNMTQMAGVAWISTYPS